MTAPFEFTNRFDILLASSPTSLEQALSPFAESDITPAKVSATRQERDSMIVTIIVPILAERNARAIQKQLKSQPFVKNVFLEHMVR